MIHCRHSLPVVDNHFSSNNKGSCYQPIHQHLVRYCPDVPSKPLITRARTWQVRVGRASLVIVIVGYLSVHRRQPSTPIGNSSSINTARPCRYRMPTLTTPSGRTSRRCQNTGASHFGSAYSTMMTICRTPHSKKCHSANSHLSNQMRMIVY